MIAYSVSILHVCMFLLSNQIALYQQLLNCCCCCLLSVQELDGVSWEWVAQQVGNRDHKQCMQKWYDQVRHKRWGTPTFKGFGV